MLFGIWLTFSGEVLILLHKGNEKEEYIEFPRQREALTAAKGFREGTVEGSF